ncbi:RluA family pseudouridine synthase [Amedibacillus sp. YH-ame6]
MREIEIVVSSEDTLDRIDKYISEKEEDLSRSRVQQLLSDELIFVNGQLCKAKYKVKPGDVITAEFEDLMDMEAIPEEMDLNICYEDHDVIVINKPRGVVVHPANGNQSGTLVNGLLYHCKDLSGINGVLRPGIVHRIDKDTTGLLIVAKNDKAHTSLSKQLQTKTVSRLYYALVHGVIEHEFGTIDAPIGRDVKDRQKMTVTGDNSKDARTHFKVIERFKEYTLVECRLETGRTHQIRVHMKYIGHPVVGDEKYSYRKTLKTGGQMLHAHQLTFVHPVTEEEVTVNAPLPEQFEELLKELRQE